MEGVDGRSLSWWARGRWADLFCALLQHSPASWIFTRVRRCLITGQALSWLRTLVYPAENLREGDGQRWSIFASYLGPIPGETIALSCFLDGKTSSSRSNVCHSYVPSAFSRCSGRFRHRKRHISSCRVRKRHVPDSSLITTPCAGSLRALVKNKNRTTGCSAPSFGAVFEGRYRWR